MTPSRDPAVEKLLEERAHPKRAEIDLLRSIVLEADERMVECVKWGGPTFAFAGGRANLGTITLRSTKMVTLFLQEGASLPDPTGLLEGDAEHVRTARFSSLDEIREKSAAIGDLVRAFCNQCAETPRGGGQRKRA